MEPARLGTNRGWINLPPRSLPLCAKQGHSHHNGQRQEVQGTVATLECTHLSLIRSLNSITNSILQTGS